MAHQSGSSSGRSGADGGHIFSVGVVVDGDEFRATIPRMSSAMDWRGVYSRNRRGQGSLKRSANDSSSRFSSTSEMVEFQGRTTALTLCFVHVWAIALSQVVKDVFHESAEGQRA